eukprot:1997533-Amphidinium_carterae.1
MGCGCNLRFHVTSLTDTVSLSRFLAGVGVVMEATAEGVWLDLVVHIRLSSMFLHPSRAGRSSSPPRWT